MTREIAPSWSEPDIQDFMRNTSNKATRTRRTWLERTGYVLAGVGILLLILLSSVLPINLFGDHRHYYRVAPVENGWIMAAVLSALGILLALIGRVRRTKSR
ncbi:hypothetical protein [Variovorax sp. KBW07]|uniref:hypothetical protein n=1 Tax=Variovorax sp. KBW07 TaxID=2153358 RepID=UPI000F55C848|nr:hypothetical protein [Variovorax sp. KBW07]